MTYPVWTLAIFIEAYRERPNDIERVKDQSEMLFEFLVKEGLIKPGQTPRVGCRDYDFEIHLDDLTDEGIAMVEDGAVDRWLFANDNPQKELSVRSLKRGLKKVRSR